MMRRANANPRGPAERRNAPDVTRRRGVPQRRSADQPADPDGRTKRRLYVPGRLLTDDNIDEIAKDIVDMLRRTRVADRG